MCPHGQPLRRRGSGIEFLESGLEIVGVERDARRDPVVGVDLDDAEYVGVERPSALFATRKRSRLRASTSRGSQGPSTLCPDPDVSDRPHARDYGVPTGSDPAPTTRRRSSSNTSSAIDSVTRAPVAGREARPEALVRLACRVLQPRRRAGRARQTLPARRRCPVHRKARSR